VRDPAAHREAIETVIAAASAQSWHPAGLVASPLTGPAGNHEYLLWLRTLNEAGSGNQEPIVDRAAIGRVVGRALATD